jgi:hypothetical protein
MPAVEITKLRLQIARLLPLIDQPEEFYRGLRDLLELYIDRAYRPGTSMPGIPILPSYRPPALVARRLELDLISISQTHPEQALHLADRLWLDTYLETRILAATILGQIPLSYAEDVLERLKVWAIPEEDRTILKELLNRGTVRLRREGPDALLELFEHWLRDPNPSQHSVGLKALLPLIKDPDFENIPPVFSALFPLVGTSSPNLFNDLTAVLEALAKRTPGETVYFLRQVLSSPVSKDTPRLARRILPLLTPSLQETLRNALRSIP